MTSRFRRVQTIDGDASPIVLPRTVRVEAEGAMDAEAALDPGERAPEPDAVFQPRSGGYTVLVITDRKERVRHIRVQLEPIGYQVLHVDDAVTALERLIADPPDLLLCDLHLQTMTGDELCRAAKRRARTEHIPFILMADSPNVSDKARGYQAGADDFFAFPMHAVEVRARARAFVRLKMHYQHMNNEMRVLRIRLQERSQELENITLGLVAALEKANEMNDSDTGRHIQRVCQYSKLLAELFGIGEATVQRIFRYASLHDVGKVAVPDRILKKPGKLTPDEMEEMKRHTIHGYKLLKEARADDIACNIALSHHERWDGTGYPQGLSGEVIPVEARIVALADVFDALTSRRCYKPALATEEAVAYLEREAGAHFDPRLVHVFLRHLDAVGRITHEYADEVV